MLLPLATVKGWENLDSMKHWANALCLAFKNLNLTKH